MSDAMADALPDDLRIAVDLYTDLADWRVQQGRLRPQHRSQTVFAAVYELSRDAVERRAMRAYYVTRIG